MTIGAVHAIANGLSTDHPIPGLAFVNDAHIPVDDPDAIEAIGRGQGMGRHGRCDGGFEYYGSDKRRQWWAGTTEPDGTDLAWCVRYHPEHGRTVVLVRNEDAWTLHHDWEDDDGPLLFRSGGYWWDGTNWYRPLQVFDYATERYVRRQVAGATTITAADFLAATGNTSAATAAVLTITDVHNAAHDGVIQPMTVRDWDPHLALWAGRRRTTALPLSECVIDLSAPELAADQLIGTPELAARAGLAPSTLRAYATRNRTDIPGHQATISGRNLWSKRVADDWAESRNRRPENIDAAMAATSELSVGQADIQQRFATRFLGRIWSPPFRKQWRLRDETTAQERANELATVVATNLDDIISIDALTHTVQQAIMAEFRDAAGDSSNNRPGRYNLYVPRHTATLLDWIVRNYPSSAAMLINSILRAARNDLELPQAATTQALHHALAEHGRLSEGEYEAFLDRALPPIAG